MPSDELARWLDCEDCGETCPVHESIPLWRCRYCKALNPGWGSDALVVQNSLDFQWWKLGRESREAAQVIKAEFRKSRVGRCLLWVERKLQGENK